MLNIVLKVGKDVYPGAAKVLMDFMKKYKEVVTVQTGQTTPEKMERVTAKVAPEQKAMKQQKTTMKVIKGTKAMKKKPKGRN